MNIAELEKIVSEAKPYDVIPEDVLKAIRVLYVLLGRPFGSKKISLVKVKELIDMGKNKGIITILNTDDRKIS